ncbi:hypothetical protein DSLASN_04450 [Desulfoluna limicola]|uniref:DUF2339 domain-containing protein n=1 Tax=Desulfoluna limicola TaxID=2810562 RepID=A0ABN6EZ98_9BACT|nr:DUF2339 domain-containing protein [Desulfoluna limicola]BCS94813.1 hypothetical protein DSLASN_04450 [Desulfoluna limicola]
MYVFILIILAICIFIKLNSINKELSKRIDALEKDVRRLYATRAEPVKRKAEPPTTEAEKTPIPRAHETPMGEMILEKREVPPSAPSATKGGRERYKKRPPLLAPPALFIETAPKAKTPSPKNGPRATHSSWASQWKSFKKNVDWELFAGTRLFAWLGGIALFIAAGFFVKYSIDNNLIPAQLRLAIGAVTGIALLISSGRIKTDRYDILRQTLAAGGIGVLYSVAFAATLYYQYIPKAMGFGLLSLISATAFVLSAFYKRISISVLGAMGAFVTPLLVSTGRGSLLLLFLYLAVVSTGLQRVSRTLASPCLIFIAAAGTLFAAGCATLATFGSSSALAMAVMWSAIPILFALFLAPDDLMPEENQSIRWAGFLSFLPSLAVALVLTLDRSGWHSLLIITATSAAALALGLQNKGWHPRVAPFSVLTFIPALGWAATRFDAESASVSYLLFLIYGVTGGLGPIALMARHGHSASMLRWMKIFPAAVVAASLLALLGTPFQNILFWPVMLGLQLVGIGVSLVIGALLQVLLLILLFIGGGLFWLFSMPPGVIGIGFFLFLLVAGSLLVAAMIAFIKVVPKIAAALNIPEASGIKMNRPTMEQWLTAAPSVGVFLLLGAAFAIKHPHYPHAGMVTLVSFLALSLFFSKRLDFQPSGIIAILAAATAQSIWVLSHGDTTILFSAVTWSSVLFLAALILPFLFFKEQGNWHGIWNSAALFEVAQMLFVLYAVKYLWPGDLSGWLPLAPALLKLGPVAILLKRLEKTPHRNSILAFHGGALLFYLSTLPVLLLPHGWIGVALVFEASLLLWLNRRVEHTGLRWVALFMAPSGLLVLVTALPLMKEAGNLPIFNPAFFSVAACTAALGAAVKLSPWPDRKLGRMDLPNTFLWMSLGTGFYLINLAIADFFAGPGEAFMLIPDGDFIHWATYALAWTGFGAITWRISRLHIAMRLAGLVLFFSGSTGLLLLPMLLSEAIATMAPFVNPALFIYLALIAMAWFTFKKEPWNVYSGLTRNLFLAFLLLAGFMLLTLASSTTLATGHAFSPFFSQTPQRAVASAAAWILYGTGMLLWPKRLDRPFRLTGLSLVLIGLVKSLTFPLRFSDAFGLMPPLINTPTLLYAGGLALLTFMTTKPWATPWPLPKPSPRTFWGITLATTGFCVLNIEIASFFATKGETFSFLTHGSLSKQLAYSIGWMIFSMGLLTVGVKRKDPNIRWAAIALLSVTSLKIFVRDLWSLGQLYRVGSFVGLAVVMILVSVIYQKFLSEDDKDEQKSEQQPPAARG